ncbi:MAG TPA: hypothetical protein VFE06_02120 [Acidobacteriaceae bacterium]|jgi:hypothetical protein|nr:hypothetical protein [Acidobacteriaceae bacterium]
MIVTLLVNGFVVWFVVQAVRSLIRDRRKQAERSRNQEELVVSPRSGLAMGAMFLGLQAIVNPEARHAIVEILEEQSLDDGSGEEPPGGRAFHEGLRRIRRGEEVENLTVALDAPGQLGDGAASGLQEETRSS